MFYADDAYGLVEQRKEFVNASNKKGLTMFYSIEDLGGGYNPDYYPSESFAYTRSVNHIADQMGKDYWYKIDGKPVIMWRATASQIDDTTSSDIEGVASYYTYMTTTLSRIKSKCTSLYPSITSFYVILECEGYYKGSSWMTSAGFDAISWYYSFGPEFDTFAEVSTTTSTEMERLASAGVAVAPPITCGGDARARWWTFLNGGIISNYYEENDVLANLPTLINTVNSFMNTHSSCKLGFVDMADENTEQGTVFYPRKRRNGTINDNIQQKFKEVLNP